MAEKLNPEERALEAVKARNPDHMEFFVGSVIPRYLHGTLYMIGFKDSQGIAWENYAFVPDEDGPVQIYRNTIQLAHAVSINSRQSSFMERILNIGGMSGAIAVAITATICYLTLTGKGEIKIPDVLSNALTMVLGFYFGSKASERKE
ncbi:hypothetical protein [Pseudaeromonas pectinilytica]